MADTNQYNKNKGYVSWQMWVKQEIKDLVFKHKANQERVGDTLARLLLNEEAPKPELPIKVEETTNDLWAIKLEVLRYIYAAAPVLMNKALYACDFENDWWTKRQNKNLYQWLEIIAELDA
jgi:hypothetical protein